MIGGNTLLELQAKETTRNEIGEAVELWATVQTLTGWLDYQSGDSSRTSFNSKIQQSTHFFICDYTPLDASLTDEYGNVREEKTRAICNGQVYDVLIIDNPMSMNRQLEIYLKYTGAQ